MLLSNLPKSYLNCPFAAPVYSLRRDPDPGSGFELSRKQQQQQHCGSSGQQPQARNTRRLRQLAGSGADLQQ